MGMLLIFGAFGRFDNVGAYRIVATAPVEASVGTPRKIGQTMLMRRCLVIGIVKLACAITGAAWLPVGASSVVVAAPDPAFTKWLDGLWPQAEAMGISRKTFTSATHGLAPD